MHTPTHMYKYINLIGQKTKWLIQYLLNPFMNTKLFMAKPLKDLYDLQPEI